MCVNFRVFVVVIVGSFLLLTSFFFVRGRFLLQRVFRSSCSACFIVLVDIRIHVVLHF